VLLFDHITNRSVSASYTSAQCIVVTGQLFLFEVKSVSASVLSSAFFSSYFLQQNW